MRGFGLSRDEWKALNGQLDDAENITAIIHNGAAVDWSADFAALKAVNVDSTVQLINIAFNSLAHPKVVYISGGGSVDQGRDTTERIAAARSLTAHNLGYTQTKVLSELIVSECASRLPEDQNMLSTVKPGRIVGTPDHGVANTDDLLWRIVSAAVSIRAYPQEPPEHHMLVADTEVISSRILQQLFPSASRGTESSAMVAVAEFAPFAPITHAISIPDFWRIVSEVLDDSGTSLQAVSWDKWLSTVQIDLETERENHVLWPVQSFLGSLATLWKDEHDQSRVEEDVSSHRIKAALRKNAAYLIDTGFLDASGTGNRDAVGRVFKRSGL